jgi:endonuclease/exonuclease/phosphatase family metal-dependent hydrolase
MIVCINSLKGIKVKNEGFQNIFKCNLIVFIEKTGIERMTRLICYNIEYCEGIEGRWYEYLKFWKIFFPPKHLDLKIIKTFNKLKADIIALVEVDIGSFRSRGKDEVRYIAKETGLKNFIEKIKYPINGWMSLFHHIPILDMQANGVVSKYKFHGVCYHIFHEGTKRMIIEASVNCPKKVTLLICHLALGKENRRKQIQELINIVNKIKNPVILMGDFNTFNGDIEIRELLRRTKLDDKISLDKEDLPLTEPSWSPSRRLDYILTSNEIRVKKYKILNYHFSDHLPVMIDFEVK